MMLQEFKNNWKDANGMNGIIANIHGVHYYAGGVNISIDFKSGKNTKPVSSILHLSYTSEEECYRVNTDDIQSRRFIFKNIKNIKDVVWIDDKFEFGIWKYNIHPFRSNNNTTLNWCNSSIAAETYVLCAEIWVLGTKGHQLKEDYSDYCADCKDCSGTVSGRNKYNIKFNIRPTNLQLVTKAHNSRLGNKIHDSSICV